MCRRHYLWTMSVSTGRECCSSTNPRPAWEPITCARTPLSLSLVRSGCVLSAHRPARVSRKATLSWARPGLGSRCSGAEARVTDTRVEAPHVCWGSVACRPRCVILETCGVRGGRDDPRVQLYERGDVEAHDDARPLGLSPVKSLGPPGRPGGIRGRVGRRARSRATSGSSTYLERLIRRPGAAARPALRPADAGGP